MISKADRLLNDFATRSFRDLADQDYITARFAYRCRLVPQFLWSAQQALEKYLKCILLLHRIKANRGDHDLEKLLARTSALPFAFNLQSTTIDQIKHINVYGRYVRYLEAPFYVMGHALPKVDSAVWDIRQYCQLLHPSGQTSDPVLQAVLQSRLHEAQTADRIRPASFKLPDGGLLESIVADRSHVARGHLLWQNLYFGARHRARIRYSTFSHGTNSQLSLYPEMLPELEKLVFIPNDIREAVRQAWLPANKAEAAAARKAAKARARGEHRGAAGES